MATAKKTTTGTMMENLAEKTAALQIEENEKKNKKRTRLISLSRDNDRLIRPEVRFKRVLYYGTELPLYQPGDRLIKDSVFEQEKLCLDNHISIPHLIHLAHVQFEKNKQEEDREKAAADALYIVKEIENVEPDEIPMLNFIMKALKDEEHPHPECPVFLLACCARSQSCAQGFSTAAYKVAKEYLKAFEHICLFLKFAVPVTKQKMPLDRRDKISGWGRGTRTLVTQWYDKQNPVELAKLVTHQAKYHGWSHKDLFKLSHYKPSAVGQQAIVYYVFHGLTETEQKFADNADAKEVIEEFKKRRQELDSSPEDLAKLIEKHKLKPCDVVSQKINHVAVWQALLKNMTTAEILKVLPYLMKLRMAGIEEVHKLLAETLSTEGQGATVAPVDIYIAMRNYCMQLQYKGHAFNSAYVEEKMKKLDVNVRLPKEPDVPLMQSLTNLLTASFKGLEAAGVRMLVALDLRTKFDTPNAHKLSQCAWTHSLSPVQAMAVTSLSLARTNKRFTLTTFQEGQEMQIISVPKSATIDSMIDKFKEFQGTAAKAPTLVEPLNWAKERKRDLDLFIVMTPIMAGWTFKGHDIGKTLSEYRDTLNKPDARLAVCSLCNMSIHIGNPRSPGIFDLVGFGPKTIQILQCLSQGKF